MKRLPSILLALALFAPFASAQTSNWAPDKAHSGVDFSILHLSLSKVRGHFGNITGVVVWDEADITKSTVNVTIDTTTVDTGVPQRDSDLKSANYFDVAQFPTATFVSKKALDIYQLVSQFNWVRSTRGRRSVAVSLRPQQSTRESIGRIR